MKRRAPTASTASRKQLRENTGCGRQAERWAEKKLSRREARSPRITARHGPTKSSEHHTSGADAVGSKEQSHFDWQKARERDRWTRNAQNTIAEEADLRTEIIIKQNPQ